MTIDHVTSSGNVFADLGLTDPEERLVKSKLAAALRPSLTCECIALPDLAAVPMGGAGLDERVFASLDPLLIHGPPLW